MVQLSFVERAKQGDPTAIEYLMNQTLQPRGVTAKTYLNDRCLYVVFSADRLLNRTTLIHFLQQGFATLKTGEIETIKVYAQKIGETLPAWSEEIALQSQQPGYLEYNYPSLSSGKTSIFGAVWPQTAARINQTSQSLWQQSRQILAKVSPRTTQLLHNPKVSGRLVLVGLSMFGLMLFSNMIATRFKRDSSNPAQVMPIPAWTVASSNPEAEAKQYLEQMTQAQQSFYTKNGRFASSLEELERSIGVLAQSDSYTYHLSSTDTHQSVLTAVPKVERLKSYVSLVSASDFKSTASTTAQICISNNPATLPPNRPQVVDSALQCADGSVSVLK